MLRILTDRTLRLAAKVFVSPSFGDKKKALFNYCRAWVKR
jgi:hypothetical protein